MAAQHVGEVAAGVVDVGVEHGADRDLRRRRGRRGEAADRQVEIDVVGVVAQARLQEGIELVDRGEGAGKPARRIEDGVGRATARRSMPGRRSSTLTVPPCSVGRAADIDAVAQARAADFGACRRSRCMGIVAGDGHRADRVAGGDDGRCC